MKERPILFSAPMVRAILDGSKTQTRRVVKVQPSSNNHQMATCIDTTGNKNLRGKHHWIELDGNRVVGDDGVFFSSPYGYVGDQLWVRETWRPLMIIEGPCSGNSCVEYPDGGQKYKDGAYYNPSNHSGKFDPTKRKWKPSIHMPRWASRIQLEITGIRVERLQDISEADAWAEGVNAEEVLQIPASEAASAAFSGLWESINGAGSWDANPWVWVIEFKRVERSA